LIFFTNVQCYFYYTLLLRDIYCILTSASIYLYHVRLSYVSKGFTYLLTYLLTKVVPENTPPIYSLVVHYIHAKILDRQRTDKEDIQSR